jgi:alkyldihydroxyacetonephosphate synthase
MRTGTVTAFPDAVLRPQDEAEVERLLAVCVREGVRVVPWGGGTSVTGGVNTPSHDDETAVVALNLERLAGLEHLDRASGLATFGAGTFGPALEAALEPEGLTLGHFPQSWELSTLGGWIVTRSSGQESLGYGDIDEMVAGVDIVAPAGRLSLPAFPSTSAGPDLRELVLGSEGRFGIVTRATVRVRRRPEEIVITGTLLPSWKEGLLASRELLQSGVALDLLRLSDAKETAVALTLGLRGSQPFASLIHRWLSFRGVTEEACMMLYGVVGDTSTVHRRRGDAGAILNRHGAVTLGTAPGRRWLADRFRHPYLRDSLLDAGFATDTVETAAPWSQLPALAETVRRAVVATLAAENERGAVLCHVSHPYRDGASLYFTIFYRCPTDSDEAVALWAKLKRAATSAIVDAGGTLTHHHGVGSWHAPWLEREVGHQGIRVLTATAATLDPSSILNPHVLLDPIDRLEV